MLEALIEKLPNCQNNLDLKIGFSIIGMFRQLIFNELNLKGAERTSRTLKPKKNRIFFNVLHSIPPTHIYFRNLAEKSLQPLMSRSIKSN